MRRGYPARVLIFNLQQRMKKLLPFIAALALVGQGCLTPPAPAEPEPSDDTMMEEQNDSMMEDDGAMMEGEAMMEDGVAVFEISGKNFSFTPNVIRVKKGQKMRITFSSENGLHDWVVDEFNASTIRVNTGEEATVEFTPDEVGTFEFYCSVGQHRANGMVGTLIVEEEEAMMEGDQMMEHEE